MAQCRFGDILTQIEVPEGMSSRLTRAYLAERGIKIGKSSINSHRAGECSCATVPGARITNNTSRILVIDMERIPGLAYFFDPKTRFIRAADVVESPRTICFAARWYGEKEPIFEAEWIDAKRMVQRVWELYDEADSVVGYNIKRFDDPHFKGLWFEAGLPAPRPWKAIDLYPIVKRQFGFEHNGLDAVLKRLGAPGKTDKYDARVALAAVNGDKEAQERIKYYNIGDIDGTLWLYDRLRGWIPNHPFMGTHGDDKICNQCGSTDLKLQPTRYRAVVIDYALYRCNHCGANVRGGWQGKAAGTRGVAA
jgi:DNA polymerase elongation subunit (family B)